MKLFFLYIMSSYNFINELQNDKIKSSLIKVQALQKEYEVTLHQYQEAVQNFITNLQSEKSSKTNMVRIKIKKIIFILYGFITFNVIKSF